MADKSELLDQLKIDRSQPATTGIGVSAVVVIAALAAVVGGIGSYLLFGGVVSDDLASSSGQQTVQPMAPEALADQPAASASPSSESERILDASGYVTARRMATVSSQVAGLITEVNVEEGMRVEAGQVLARLDDELVRVDLQLAEARLESQRAFVDNVSANLAEAQRVLERATRLRPKNLVSEAQLSEATARAESLQADLKRANSDINVLELEVERQQERLEDHVITAPYAGVVTVKNAQPGEIISPSSAGGSFTRTGICTIVDMDSLEIEVDVNESFIRRVVAGQRVIATLDAYPNWDIPSKVIAIIPTADRAKATVKVRIGIEASDERILPDMGVKVAFLKN